MISHIKSIGHSSPSEGVAAIEKEDQMKVLAIHDAKGRIKSLGIPRAGKTFTVGLSMKKGQSLSTFNSQGLEKPGQVDAIVALAASRIDVSASASKKARQPTSSRSKKT